MASVRRGGAEVSVRSRGAVAASAAHACLRRLITTPAAKPRPTGTRARKHAGCKTAPDWHARAQARVWGQLVHLSRAQPHAARRHMRAQCNPCHTVATRRSAVRHALPAARPRRGRARSLAKRAHTRARLLLRRAPQLVAAAGDRHEREEYRRALCALQWARMRCPCCPKTLNSRPSTLNPKPYTIRPHPEPLAPSP